MTTRSVPDMNILPISVNLQIQRRSDRIRFRPIKCANSQSSVHRRYRSVRANAYLSIEGERFGLGALTITIVFLILLRDGFRIVVTVSRHDGTRSRSLHITRTARASPSLRSARPQHVFLLGILLTICGRFHLSRDHIVCPTTTSRTRSDFASGHGSRARTGPRPSPLMHTGLGRGR